jgi:ribosomal protein S6
MTETRDISELKKYEISCISSDDTALTLLRGILEKRKIAITEESKMVAVRLAYPVKKQTSGFFGYMHFTTLPREIEKLEKDVAGVSSIIRFLIVTPPPEVVRKEEREREPLSQKPAPSEGPKGEVSVLTNEVLEQKLEEILK